MPKPEKKPEKQPTRKPGCEYCGSRDHDYGDCPDRFNDHVMLHLIAGACA